MLPARAAGAVVSGWALTLAAWPARASLAKTATTLRSSFLLEAGATPPTQPCPSLWTPRVRVPGKVLAQSPVPYGHSVVSQETSRQGLREVSASFWGARCPWELDRSAVGGPLGAVRTGRKRHCRDTLLEGEDGHQL